MRSFQDTIVKNLDFPERFFMKISVRLKIAN